MRWRSLWAAFWFRVGAVSIRTKIMGIVAISIACTALAVVWYVYEEDSAALRAELQERGVAIGTGLAAQSRDLVLTDDLFVLHRLVEETHDANRDVVYTFILDAEGTVLVHTFDDGFPTALLVINELHAGEPFRVQALNTEDGMIQDVAVPVLGGKAGVVRLGMSENAIRALVAENIRDILRWVALVLGAGISMAYGLASILTRPVSRLAEAAAAVGSGDFQWKAPVWARDEIGSLGSAFSEMSDELRRREEKRTQLLAKVISAQEEERKRIARELHDETSQALTSLMVGLKYIEDSSDAAPVKKKTAELRALAARTLDEVHHLALELRPSLLDDLGLASAVERYAKEYAAYMKINVDTHVSGFGGLRLPSEIEVAVYRIIQEALTNVAKYAEATNVSVVLRHRESTMVAIVEDDGKGFDVYEAMTTVPADGKLGLFGMYERASLIGGKISIESYPGGGTTVFVELPLKEAWGAQDGKD